MQAQVKLRIGDMSKQLLEVKGALNCLCYWYATGHAACQYWTLLGISISCRICAYIFKVIIKPKIVIRLLCIAIWHSCIPGTVLYHAGGSVGMFLSVWSITVVNILHSVNSLTLYTVAWGSVGVSSVWSCCTVHEVQWACPSQYGHFPIIT